MPEQNKNENERAEASKKPDLAAERYEQIRRRELFGEDPEDEDVSVYELRRRKRARFLDHLVCDIMGKHRLITFLIFLVVFAAMTVTLALLGDREGYVCSVILSVAALIPLLVVLKNPKKTLYGYGRDAFWLLVMAVAGVVVIFFYSISNMVIAAV